MVSTAFHARVRGSVPGNEIPGVDYYSMFNCLEDANLPIDNACNHLQTVI